MSQQAWQADLKRKQVDNLPPTIQIDRQLSKPQAKQYLKSQHRTSNAAATSCYLDPGSAVTRALRSLYLSRCLPLGQRTWAPGEDTRGSNGATAKPRIGVPRRACDPTSGPKRPRGRHACDKRLQSVCNSPVVCLSKSRMYCIWASPF